MAELESPIVVVQERRESGDSLTLVIAKFLLHAFIATGIVLGFVFLNGTLSWRYFYFEWGGVFYYDLYLVQMVGVFLAFGILEGLVNRRIGRAFWSVSKNSILADMFVRGPIAFAVSWFLAFLMVVPVISALFPYPQMDSPLSQVATFVLFVLLMTPVNGLVAVATIRWRFGNPHEVVAGTATTFGTCPYCKAAYYYSPSAMVGGQVRCQNCDKSFRLLAEGPSVG